MISDFDLNHFLSDFDLKLRNSQIKSQTTSCCIAALHFYHNTTANSLLLTYSRVTGARRSDRIGYQYASELLSRWPYWYTNVGTAWLRRTCRHTASQRHHTAVGVICALLSPVNSLFHVRGQTTETAVLPFTGQSCGTVFQPTSVWWTCHCQCSGNDWKCSCSRTTVIVQRLTWRICCVAKFAPYKCH